MLQANCNMNHQNHRGNTALHYAAAYKYDALFDYMKAHGADETLINVLGMTAKQGLA
jgi:ankyrin repeat protein